VISRKITPRNNFAASRLSAMWHWHVCIGIAQLVAHETGESILCMRSSQITWWHWGERTYCL